MPRKRRPLVSDPRFTIQKAGPVEPVNEYCGDPLLAIEEQERRVVLYHSPSLGISNSDACVNGKFALTANRALPTTFHDVFGYIARDLRDCHLHAFNHHFSLFNMTSLPSLGMPLDCALATEPLRPCPGIIERLNALHVRLHTPPTLHPHQTRSERRS